MEDDARLTRLAGLLLDVSDDVTAEAIAGVREGLLTQLAPRKGDLRLFYSQLPRSIARVLAGDSQWLGVLHDNGWLARDYYVALGEVVAAYWSRRRDDRERAGRKKGGLQPSAEELANEFGEDAEFVRAVWPVVPFLVAVLDVRRDASLAADEREQLEEQLWAAANTHVGIIRPNDVLSNPKAFGLRGGIPELVREAVARIGRSKNWSEQHERELQARLLEKIADETLARRMLSAKPAARRGEEGVLVAARRRLKLMVIDAAKQRVPIVGVGVDVDELSPEAAQDESELDVPPDLAAPTVRGYVHRGLATRSSSAEKLQDVWRENSARRAHRDPERKMLNVRQAAKRIGCKPGTLSAALRRYEKGSGDGRHPSRSDRFPRLDKSGARGISDDRATLNFLRHLVRRSLAKGAEEAPDEEPKERSATDTPEGDESLTALATRLRLPLRDIVTAFLEAFPKEAQPDQDSDAADYVDDDLVQRPLPRPIVAKVEEMLRG